ncbi:hypothetical protein ACLESO_32250 [Pyxidicoccus sp. 3LG]
MRTHILKWMVMVTCLHGTLASAQAQISVWHALNGQTEAAFYDSVLRFEEDTGHVVAVAQFSSQAELYDVLMTAVAAGDGPDVVVGSHTLAPGLLEAGVLAPYCIPGECPECESANPPRWCSYASNGLYESYYDPRGYGGQLGDSGFAATMIPELELNSSRCVEEDCAECNVSTLSPFGRPLYCNYIHSNARLDVLQAGFAVWHYDWEWPFPIGIPVWWNHLSYAFDRAWLEEIGREMPTTFEEAQEAQSEAGGINIYAWDGDFCGNEPYRFKIPIPIGPLPDPWEDSPISLVPSEQLASLVEARPNLEVAVIEGHRPEIIVTGAFMLSTTQEREASLDFMYELGSDATQLAGADGTTFLPTNNTAFLEAGELVPGLRDSGLNGVLAPSYHQ